MDASTERSLLTKLKDFLMADPAPPAASVPVMVSTIAAVNAALNDAYMRIQSAADRINTVADLLAGGVPSEVPGPSPSPTTYNLTAAVRDQVAHLEAAVSRLAAQS